MHARRGLWADARRIWARALSIKGSSLEQGDEHEWLFVLRKSWALMEALCGRGLDMCVGILGASVGEFSELADLCESRESGCVSSVDVLRAKRVVDAAAAECRATTVSRVDVAVADEVRRALLTAGLWVAYARGRDCGAVNEYYKRSVGEQAEAQRDEVTVARGEADRELLAMEVCSVYLYHAATCKVYRAGDLRLHLTQSVSRYVHNTAFWQMLVAMESQTRMSIHVYRHLMTVLGDHRTADLYMLGVYCQQNENSARWLLRRFSQDRWAAQSVSLWTVYVMFELECGHLKRAKKAVLSALLHCPWAKPLYLLCLGACALAEQFTSDEKVMLVRGMVNAGLRSYNLLRQ
ncbi:hypothetical protein LPJ56_003444 [Coemansia sp. RSA 2599]|nr:hypothetical protein LPJ56_003444 [Coemansia sp. RSA 2599]